MIICHVCKAECEESNELCSVCGAQLIIESAETQTNTKDEETIQNPTLLASVEDVVSAEIFKDILKDNNILYVGDSQRVDGAIQVTFGGGFISEDIYVDEKDFDRAKELYAEFLESEEQNFFFDEENEEV